MQCVHLASVERDAGFLQRLHSLRHKLTHQTPQHRRCFSCAASEHSVELFVCCECVFVGCRGHISQHVSSHHGEDCYGVAIGVAVPGGDLYCVRCGDYIHGGGMGLAHQCSLTRQRRKSRLRALHGWRSVPEGSDSDSDSDSDSGAEPVCDVEEVAWKMRKVVHPPIGEVWGDEGEGLAGGLLVHSEGARFGIRGLDNLGNTCFMNAVLQMLAHCPPLRDFFLSDFHNRKRCKKSVDHCLSCALDELISEMYSADQQSMTTPNVLVAMWKFADYLAGYDQQDAHEFLIAALNGIHMTCAAELESGDHCDCIVHSIFGGVLESSVTCQTCQKVSPHCDPIFDLSMEISSLLSAAESPSGDGGTPLSLGSPLSPPFHAGSLCTLPHAAPTLEDCLRRYTRTERLAETERISCDQCNANTMGRKKLCFLKLPQVLCLHLKRFEHGMGGGRVLNQHISFPTCGLDMEPFLKPELRTGEPILYDLLGLVTHEGHLDRGHYVTFVRHSGQWFMCADSVISTSDEDQVRAQSGFDVLSLFPHTHMHMHCVCLSLSPSVCVCVYIYVCMCVCVCTYMYVCVCVCVYIYVCMCVCVSPSLHPIPFFFVAQTRK